MKKIFILSKDNLELAKEEVLSLSGAKEHKLIGNLLILETGEEHLEKRLAFTKQILQFLFECTEKEINKQTCSFEWNKIYTDSFRVHVAGKKNREKELADIIWEKLKGPKTDLRYAMTTIEFFFIEGKVIAGLLEHVVKKDFLNRKSHLLPESHPTAMNPKLARALVNISGAGTGDSILDPFCGAGGMLIEAGLMRFKTFGWDIDKIMLRRAQKNLEAFMVKRFHLEHRDSLSINERHDIVITDLPYGRNSTTAGKELQELYSKFLDKYYDYISKGMVVVFPSFCDYKSLIKKTKWKIKKEFSSYLHKSLSRKIVVLGK